MNESGVRMDNQMVTAMGKEYVMNTYNRYAIGIARGKGSTVWDCEGNAYLDLVAGIAVNNVGHCHPKVVKAIQDQAELLIHCSNLYWNEPQVKLAKLLTEVSCADKIFFCNSGAEANEGALKLARKWAARRGDTNRTQIVSALNSFHGRTLGALTATGQTKYQDGFGPLLPDFHHVPFNDLAALQKVVGPQTAAVLLEPVQGEGGVLPMTPEYLAGVAQLREEFGFLIIMDEVQTGLGRTGKLFGHDHFTVKPDVFTLAKGLGGGAPIGALAARGEAALALQPGDHATTFGGNPLVTAAALAALSVILDEDLSRAAQEKGEYIKTKISRWRDLAELIVEVRGKGLMLGIEVDCPGSSVVEYCLKKKVLVNCIHDQVIRLVPPLTISYEEIDQALAVLKEALEMQKKAK
jgi:acetylornithine/N-succinyldiaminopimelate aminotransferase